MTLEEIKTAVDNGKTVRWKNSGYEVIKFKGHYYVRCLANGYTIGLTWSDDVNLNGKEEDYLLVEPEPQEEFPCLIITLLNDLRTDHVYNMLEDSELIADSYTANEFVFGLEGLKDSDVHVYDFFIVFDRHRVDMNNVKFTIENRSM